MKPTTLAWLASLLSVEGCGLKTLPLDIPIGPRPPAESIFVEQTNVVPMAVTTPGVALDEPERVSIGATHRLGTYGVSQDLDTGGDVRIGLTRRVDVRLAGQMTLTNEDDLTAFNGSASIRLQRPLFGHVSAGLELGPTTFTDQGKQRMGGVVMGGLALQGQRAGLFTDVAFTTTGSPAVHGYWTSIRGGIDIPKKHSRLRPFASVGLGERSLDRPEDGLTTELYRAELGFSIRWGLPIGTQTSDGL